VEVTPYGFKNDRIWVIIDTTTMEPVAAHNSHLITFFRVVFVKDDPNSLKICLQDTLCFPDIKKRSVILKLNQNYTEAEFVQAESSYRGYKERDEINDFLSLILQQDVMLLRSSPSRLMHIDKESYIYALETDRRASFLTDGAISLLNNQSCQQLVLGMYNKYVESREYIQMANADIPTFRPNIVIDEEFDEMYCEDEFHEMRIANIMFR
jgi:uncharacterized protein YcbX